MRKFFVPAMEGAQFGNGTVLSLEEEQITLDEAGQDAAEVSQDLAEAERIIEVSDALEDLAVIADGIEEATPTEIALIENAGDMAVAGSDVEAEQVVPAMESFKGGRIATEGIRETAAAIWKSIQDFLKKVWTKIEGFFYKLFGTIPSLRKRIEALEKKVDATAGMKLENDGKKFKVSAGVKALCVDFAPVKTEGDVEKAVAAFEETVKWAFGLNTEAVSKLGEDIADQIGDFDPSKPGAPQCEKLATTLENHFKAVKKFPGEQKITSTSVSGFAVHAGTQLLGNVRMERKIFTGSLEKDSVLANLDRCRRSGVELGAAREKGGTVPSDFDFQTMSPGAASGLLKTCSEMLDKLEDFKRGKGWKEIKKAKDKLDTASAKATKAFEKTKGSEEEAEKQAVPYYRSMLNFNTSYARWTQQPYMAFSGHALTTIRAVLMLVDRSMGQYK